MFAARFFAPKYFAPRYFPHTTEPAVANTSGGYSGAGRVSKGDDEILEFIHALPALRKEDEDILAIIMSLIQSGQL